MIRVCHIVNLITGRADGVYAHLKSIFRNYDRTKFEHFLIFQGGEKIEKEVQELGVKVFASNSLNKKISIKAFIDIYRKVKTNKIDIIHGHLIKPYSIAGLVNIILGKKIIFNYHGIFLKNNPYYNIFEKNIYRVIHYLIYLFSKVDIVLVPSKMSKQVLMEESKLFPEPIVYYNGYRQIEDRLTDSVLKKELDRINSKGIIIGMVARLEIQKGIDRALELFNLVLKKRNDLFLVVFGDGSEKEEYIKKVNDLGLSSNVTFFDYVPEINSCYSYFDLLLFTSDYEGMPLTMWEAMANSIPLIAPDVGGFKEILEENNCGLIYEPGNILDAEVKLNKIIDDENLRKSLGRNGRIAVETKYTEDKFIKQIEKVYSNLMTK